jgi:hypothetical protein
VPEFHEMTKEQQLAEVNKAIYAVLAGGQSYTIGSRSLTRADLSLLKEMREELEAEITSDTSSRLLDNTFVAYFEGR